MSQQETPHPLSYSPAPPPRWGRWRRPAIYLAAIVSIITLGWQYGPGVFVRFQLVHYQSQCMDFTAPPTVVVYERLSDDAVPGPPPPGYASIRRLVVAQDTAGYGPICLQGLNRTNMPFGVSNATFPWNTAIAFLHQRTSHNGSTYLVIVGVNQDRHKVGTDGITFSASSFGSEAVAPATLFRQAGLLNHSQLVIPLSKMNSIVRIFAGQVDQNDVSHFTIDYDTDDGMRHTFDGWLQDDTRVKLVDRPRVQTQATTANN